MPEDRTLWTLASEAAATFSTKTNTEGKPYVVTCADDVASLSWVAAIVFDAHDGKLPNNWTYAAVDSAFDFIAGQPDTPFDEMDWEWIDGMVDVYTSERIDWLASHPMRLDYCDEAASDGLVTSQTSMVDRIGAGQAHEARMIWHIVTAGLEARAEELGL